MAESEVHRVGTCAGKGVLSRIVPRFAFTQSNRPDIVDFTGRIINANEDLLILNGEQQGNLSACYSRHGGIGKFNMLHMAVVQRIFFAGD